MQEKIDIEIEKKLDTVDSFEFEPIKGYPMLRWAGKRPFTSTQYYPAQLKEVHGEETEGWLNKIFWGDNLQVMSHMLKKYRGKVDLIYIDPPFDSNTDYKKIISVKVIPANQILEEILCEHEFLDILKIDVEGYENKILSHLSLGNISHIGRIYAETTDFFKLQEFTAKRYGGLTRYFRKKIMR